MQNIKIFTQFQFLLIATLVFTTNSFAATAKEYYEFQEKCRKSADEVFHKHWDDNPAIFGDYMISSSYQNHYNKKLNKCILWATTNSASLKKEYKSQISMTLLDIQENRDIGVFASIGMEVKQCFVDNEDCSSQLEWVKLIIPYMER